MSNPVDLPPAVCGGGAPRSALPVLSNGQLLAEAEAPAIVQFGEEPAMAQPRRPTAANNADIRPFRIDVLDEALADLRRRVAVTRRPERKAATGKPDRRRFLSGAGLVLAAAHLGLVGCAQTPSNRTQPAELTALTPAATTSFDAPKQINAGLLNVGYAEAGPASGPPVILLHGWPYDIHSYAVVAPILAAEGYRVVVPYLRGYGTTHFLSSATVRNGQQSVVALDLIALLDALKVQKAILAGFDWGARTADIVAALWPERCKALVSVSGYLIGSQQAGKVPLPPEAELAWWYQYYFAIERGKLGYSKYTHDFNKLIWQLASPKWSFDDATFERTAAAFNNPDHVDIVIHNYRWRLDLAPGEPQYDQLEQQLATGPTIGVPTITMEGDANGAPHADASAYAKKFVGKYAHRVITGGIGHNLPQEAPQAFAQAVMDVDRF
jgi:pimeloyl-ACP methyl ester carboxylesterase